jgi:TatD DNase family protein
MTLVDSHCHLDLLEGGDDPLDAAVVHAREGGVRHFLCVSISLQRLPAMLARVAHLDDVSVSAGIHPNERLAREPTLDELLAAADHPRVVAIGETGLDYFRSDAAQDWQLERFRRHVAAAAACGKPLIIHSRDAWDDTLALLREQGTALPPGVMHCFTGDWAVAEQVLELGYYISFSGIVTFNSAVELREVATRMPLERMLVETDCPYLAPVPHRGKPNKPGYVRHVAESIAALRGVPVAAIAAATTANFTRLFGVPVALDTPGSVA